jgi:hypothetical protein
MDAGLTALSRSLVVEIAGSIGLHRSLLAHQIIWPLLRHVTDRLARIALSFDRNVMQLGFSKAMGITLEDFANPVTSRGTEGFPPEGPLLVVSNHPGTVDSLVIASLLQRDDLHIISSDIPFLQQLPHANQYFFSTSENENGRMLAARKAIRHLKTGGAVLLYGYGHIDPDPAVYDNAASHIDQWSPSIDLFLKAAPQTRLLLAMVSHVVSRKWRTSILYQLRSDPLDRRRLVEFGQVISKLLFPHRLMISPYISFSPPIGVDALQRQGGNSPVFAAILTRAKALLVEHMQWVNYSKNP